jgi:predicted neuraminidase
MKPRFKILHSTAQESSSAIFESYIIPEPDFLIASHSASFEVLDNGNLIAFWFAGSHEGKPDVKIWSSQFTHNHWSDAKIIVSPQMLSEDLSQYVHKVGNPVVYKSANGVLHLFVVSVGAIGGWSGSNIIHLQSKDSGLTWNQIQKLILTPILNISTLTRTRAIGLEGGGFYLPVYHEMIYTYPELLRFDSNGNFIQTIRMTSKRDMLQPAIVPTNMVSAYSFLRNKGSHDTVLYMQYGRKGGLSWSKPKATNISNRDSSIAVVLLDNNKLLMARNPLDRGQLVLSISDDGLNWHDVVSLESMPNMEYSYPFIQTHDGIIDILYTYDRKKIKHVRFNLQWLDKQTGKQS